MVRVSDEEPIKPARDTAANPPPLSPDARAPKSAPARSAPDSTPPIANRDSAGPKNGFVSRLNPRNWFRPKERTIVRYHYRSPAAPQPGNRGEGERWLARGVAAQERNLLSESIDAYRQATIADPSYFDAHYNLGVAAYEAGECAPSLLAYECALAINPASVKARFNFALALEKANYPEDAADQLERLLADNPSEARAHLALANLCAQQLGEAAKAREHYLRLLELQPQHPRATAIRYWLEANP
jgi:tetratricopeptide (TPR) repeat protein